MSSSYLGCDVSKRKIQLALLLPNGKFRTKAISNDSKGFQALSEWLAFHKVEVLHVCMEATNTYWEALAEYLNDQSYVVSVVNPARIKAFAQSTLTRTKTDPVDARLIARFCSLHRPEPWQAPPREVRELYALVARRQALIEMHTQEKSRLDTANPAIKPDLKAHLDYLNKAIAEIEQAIRDHFDNHPGLKRQKTLLESIPGIGEVISSILLAFLGGPQRFRRASQVVAFAGLDPRHIQSGSRIEGKPRMSKTGHRFLRRALYFPAVVTLYRTEWGKHFRQRLSARGKPPKLIIGAMMRKLLHVAFGVLKSGKPFDPSLHQLA